MAAQPRQFFGYVSPFGEHRRFLSHANGIDREGSQQFLQSYLKALCVGRTALFRKSLEQGRLIADTLYQSGHIVNEGTPFFLAHLVEPAKRLLEARGNLCSEQFEFLIIESRRRGARRCRRGNDTGKRQ